MTEVIDTNTAFFSTSNFRDAPSKSISIATLETQYFIKSYSVTRHRARQFEFKTN